MAAAALKLWLLNRVFRADFVDDALEAVARNALAGRVLRSRLQRIVWIAPAVLDTGALFIHIPKNAGTSVSWALYGGPATHRSVRLYEFAAPDLAARSYKFAVLRDPVERFLSAFDFVLNGGGEHVPVIERSLRRLRRVRSVDDYLDYLEKRRSNWIDIDNVGRPQTWFLTDRSGRIAVDALFTLDDLARVQEVVLRHGGGEIMHMNRTRRSVRTLSADQLRRVRRIYAADFALFRYMAGRAPDAARGLRFESGDFQSGGPG